MGNRWALLRDRLTLAVAAYLAYNIGSFFLISYSISKSFMDSR
jgi:hypothetical protein